MWRLVLLRKSEFLEEGETGSSEFLEEAVTSSAEDV